MSDRNTGRAVGGLFIDSEMLKGVGTGIDARKLVVRKVHSFVLWILDVSIARDIEDICRFEWQLSAVSLTAGKQFYA
jgi:hypothetical protein